jgi:hypothetical protein
LGTMISICGLTCTECPAFLATLNDDLAEKAAIAKMWSEQYKSDIRPEDINCEGCLSTGDRHLGYCGICEIRKCGMEKKVANCALCKEYACDKLAAFLAHAPQAKTTLEEIRKNR